MHPMVLGHDSLPAWQDMKYACAAAKETKKRSWPDGPATLAGLFEWHKRNAETLLGEGEEAAVHRRNMVELCRDGIKHFDAFSGLGTASITLKQQLCAMGTIVAGIAGPL